MTLTASFFFSYLFKNNLLVHAKHVTPFYRPVIILLVSVNQFLQLADVILVEYHPLFQVLQIAIKSFEVKFSLAL